MRRSRKVPALLLNGWCRYLFRVSAIIHFRKKGAVLIG